MGGQWFAGGADIQQGTPQALWTGRYVAGGIQRSLYWALADIFRDVRPWQVPLPTLKSYWKGEEGRERAREATIWVLAQLGQGREEGAGYAHIATRVTGADFVRIELGGMLTCVYGDSARRARSHALPEELDKSAILVSSGS
ncbi:MAG: hypothetical protein IVW55_00570 [Chloroflexi bacterium]|nr:hypothetical protein [Chloroflexota bacterium]